MEDTPPPIDTSIEQLDSRKRAYCQRFAMAHLDAFRPHFQRGKALGSGEDVWRNVAEHCLVEGIFADIIAEKSGLDPLTRDKVVRAAILHDWYKKQESAAMKQLTQNGGLTLEGLEQIKLADSEALRGLGVSEDVIALTGSNVPKDESGPQTLPEKILWYVDAMMSNTDPVPIKERFAKLERGWDGEKEDPARADRNNAFSDIYRPRYNGKSLYQVQVELADQVGAELAKCIGFEGEPDNLPHALEEMFTDRVLEAT